MKEEHLNYLGNIDVAVVDNQVEDHDIQWILEQMMKFKDDLETRNMNVSVSIDFNPSWGRDD